jgi:hypothetical protein
MDLFSNHNNSNMMMMMMMMEQRLRPVINVAIECNNIGYEVLSNKKNDATGLHVALDAFQMALKIMRNATYVTRVQQEQEPSKDSSSMMMTDLVNFATQSLCTVQELVRVHRCNCEQQRQQPPPQRQLSDQHQHVVVAQGEMNFIGNPMEIRPISDTEWLTLHVVNKKSVILLYNMGLAFLNLSKQRSHQEQVYQHQEQTQTMNMTLMRKSLSLFDMAHQLGCDPNILDDTCVQHVCMESSYYVAQLHHAQGEYDRTESVLRQLEETILSFPPTDDERELSSRRQFLFLTHFLRKPSGAPAA